MSSNMQSVDPREAYFAADSLIGLIRSGAMLLKARRVRTRAEAETSQFNSSDFWNQVLYYLLIAIPAVGLEAYQQARTAITGKPRQFPRGSWQFYLGFELREDMAHHTVETRGYHLDRPSEATELHDLTAWVMTVI